MGNMLCLVEKTKDNETWVNTYAITWGEDFENPASPSEVATVFGYGTINWNDSDVTDSNAGTAYLGNGNILAAIVGFERQLHMAPIAITNLYLTDGIKNTSTFATSPVSLACFGQPAGDEGSIMPGNVTLQVNRVPGSFSQRTGRLFYRGVLDDTHVAFSGVGGIAWSNDVVRELWSEGMQDLLDTTSLRSWFYQVPVGMATLSIPQYWPIDSEFAGNLNRCVPIGNLVAHAPVSRQVKKGKRRKQS